jgi:hypothetical protein
MTILQPTWLYKSITVDNLAQIQAECLAVFNKHYTTAFGGRGFTFIYIDQDILRAEAPTYIQFLKEIDLYEKWSATAMIGMIGESRLTDSPIHVDSTDWLARSYALNIPIVNCGDSNTVWYNVAERDELSYSSDDTRFTTVQTFKPETSTEIGRMSSNNPAWINVGIPHRAENNNANLRLLFSTRFYPELHDYFLETNNGR